MAPSGRTCRREGTWSALVPVLPNVLAMQRPRLLGSAAQFAYFVQTAVPRSPETQRQTSATFICALAARRTRPMVGLTACFALPTSARSRIRGPRSFWHHRFIAYGLFTNQGGSQTFASLRLKAPRAASGTASRAALQHGAAWPRL